MDCPRTKRGYKVGRRWRGLQLSDVWFGKAYADLSDDEMRIYMRKYKVWRTAGCLGSRDEEPYVDLTRIKKYAKGATTIRQRIQCSCGRVVSTTFTGFELEAHKQTGIHRKCLGNNPDESNISTIDRQWVFTDDDLIEGIRVKKARTLKDIINELD